MQMTLYSRRISADLSVDGHTDEIHGIDEFSVRSKQTLAHRTQKYAQQSKRIGGGGGLGTANLPSDTRINTRAIIAIEK
jgi:hypothetical protein